MLPVITGIFERHILTCLINFLDKHKLIYDNQSGFRCNHSCQTSLTKMADNWLTPMNNNEIVGAVLLDLSKAFGIVNHQIQKQKLSAYKFSHLSQRWFDSYLNNRFQQVQISGKLSRAKRSKPVFLRVLFVVLHYFCSISMITLLHQTLPFGPIRR